MSKHSNPRKEMEKELDNIAEEWGECPSLKQIRAQTAETLQVVDKYVGGATMSALLCVLDDTPAQYVWHGYSYCANCFNQVRGF